jgi:hypothetical protein
LTEVALAASVHEPDKTAGLLAAARQVAVDVSDERLRATAWRLVAVVTVRLGQPSDDDMDRAIASAWAVDLTPDRITALVRLGHDLADLNHSGATDLFELARAVAAGPLDVLEVQLGHTHDTYRADLADELAQAGRFDDARALLTEFGTASELARAQRDIAIALADAGHLDRADADASEIEERDDREQVLAVLTKRLAEAGLYDRAEALVRKIMTDSNPDIALSGLVDAFARTGQIERARAVLGTNRFSQVYYRDEARQSLAIALVRAGRDEEARALLESIETPAIRDDAERPIATALAASGRLDEALAELAPTRLDQFIAMVARWAPHFEQRHAGLALTVLSSVIDVAGWIRPDWRAVHEVLVE